MREAVTTDKLVLDKWPKGKKYGKPLPCTSAKVAEALGITVFQITARLKGMEKRGLVERKNYSDGKLSESVSSGNYKWVPTGREPAPEVKKTPRARIVGEAGGPGLPDDRHVKRLRSGDCKWTMNDKTREYLTQELASLEERLANYREAKDYKKRFKREVMVTAGRIDYIKEKLTSKKKGCWSVRYHHSKTGGARPVFIAPDGTEYIDARAFENADLIMETDFGTKRLRDAATSSIVRVETKQQREAEARAQAKKEKSNAKADRLRSAGDGEEDEERASNAASHAKGVLRSGIKAPAGVRAQERSAKRTHSTKASKGKAAHSGKRREEEPKARKNEEGKRALPRKGGPKRYTDYL